MKTYQGTLGLEVLSQLPNVEVINNVSIKKTLMCVFVDGDIQEI